MDVSLFMYIGIAQHPAPETFLDRSEERESAPAQDGWSDAPCAVIPL